MAESIYYNAPCELYRHFLRSEKDFHRVLNDIADFILYDACKSMYKSKLDAEEIKKKVKRYGINYHNPVGSWKDGEGLYIEYVENAKNAPAYFSISRETYWHFRDVDSTEFERAMLLAYLAVKSMVGKRDMIKTNMTAICSRMDGNTKPKRAAELSEGVTKYLNRYWSNKLLSALYGKRGVTFYGGNKCHKVRGFYCSTTLSMEELITKAEADMEWTRNRPADPLREARRLAMEKLNINSP